MSAVALGCAYVADLLFGDPEWLPHPVRLIGRVISGGESLARPGHGSARRNYIIGAVLSGSVVLLTTVSAVAVLATAHWLNPSLGFTAEILLAWTALATGSLLTEAKQVLNALDAHDLSLARKRLARIVGRDTDTLSESEVTRGVIETLAESTCDGILAPLCYLTIGGVPAALAYKAVNTLDSMIGHREPPYTYFGWCAARLDDLANFVPARFAALMIVLASPAAAGDFQGALRVWRRDHGHHDSPNAGHPEAAMAGALGVRLGGVNYYEGAAVVKPFLGEEGGPATRDAARRACRIVLVASMMSGTAALTAAVVAGGW